VRSIGGLSTRRADGSPYYRLLKSFLRGSFEGSLNVPRLKLRLGHGRHRDLTKRIVEKAATGKGTASSSGAEPHSFWPNRSDVFNVFVYAPYEDKVHRLIRSGMEPRKRCAADRRRRMSGPISSEKYFGKEATPASLSPHDQFTGGDEAVVRIVLNAIATHEEQPARSWIHLMTRNLLPSR
jgi:hypothetical protein